MELSLISSSVLLHSTPLAMRKRSKLLEGLWRYRSAPRSPAPCFLVRWVFVLTNGRRKHLHKAVFFLKQAAVKCLLISTASHFCPQDYMMAEHAGVHMAQQEDEVFTTLHDALVQVNI